MPLHEPDQIDAVSIGQFHVRQTEVIGSLLDCIAGLGQILNGGGLDIHTPEGNLQEFSDIRLVIDDQCARRGHSAETPCLLGSEKVMRKLGLAKA